MGNSTSINQTYLTQEQKALLKTIYAQKKTSPLVAKSKKDLLVVSVQANIKATQQKSKLILDPNSQKSKLLTQQLQIKKKNLQLIKKL